MEIENHRQLVGDNFTEMCFDDGVLILYGKRDDILRFNGEAEIDHFLAAAMYLYQNQLIDHETFKNLKVPTTDGVISLASIFGLSK